jgi:uncharacterized membrane protein
LKEGKEMRTKKQHNIIVVGWILVVIGFILLVFGFIGVDWIIDYSKSNPATYWDVFYTFRELFIPLSIILIIVGGIVLSSLVIFPSNKENNPLETLKLRYANGEITKKEFEQMKEDLEK